MYEHLNVQLLRIYLSENLHYGNFQLAVYLEIEG